MLIPYYGRTSTRKDPVLTDDEFGPAASIPNAEIGRAVARQIVSSLDGDLPAGRPGDVIVLARAAGVTVLGIQQITGMARQTVYRHQEQATPRRVDRGQARFETLVVLASRGSLTVAELARLLALPTTTVLPAVVDLDAQGFGTMVFDSDADDRRVSPTEAAFTELRRYFNGHVDRQPSGYLVCIELQEDMEPSRIQAAANAVLSTGDQETSTVAAPEVAPSVMSGNELLLLARTPTQRRAFGFTYEVWPAILDKAGLPFSPPRIRDVIPPGTPLVVGSPCLDRFVELLLDEGVGTPEVIREIRAGYSGELGEKALATRCLTEAAIALRRAAGQERNPKLIVTGDDAFDEWQVAKRLRLDVKREQVQRPTVDALDFAAHRLGPYLGGELGSVRAPDGRPVELKEISPTQDDLEVIVAKSGTAVVAAAHQDLVGADQVLERLVDVAYGT